MTAISEQWQPSKLKDELTAILEHTLGLQIDLSGFYEIASGDGSTLGKVLPTKKRAGCYRASILTKGCFISTFSLPSWTPVASFKSRSPE